MWWENEPMQSLSKSEEQTQKRRKIALPQKRAHILVSQMNGLAWTIWFLRQNFQFSLLNGEYGTPDFLEARILGAGWKTQVPIVFFPFAGNFASLYQERDKNTKCTVELTKKPQNQWHECFDVWWCFTYSISIKIVIYIILFSFLFYVHRII